ncbi:FAD-linked oxidase C-terminal domain-containing protein [Streptomyces sp. B1866]|uniref:FAD-binding and (Fe-S)-binding domain-containing protein n=1 Tax=Streptomyces sp. B1866 TaxID=3075431 RepID=UPI00288CBFDB|nr:FAD-linked oxidase C-terminal domain-containing protein [Streptomyces sp. B1866]MDT3395133.1 FAD-linked oxidase C-terminal domain-containing protein [Streptomyces sp. B1866]
MRATPAARIPEPPGAADLAARLRRAGLADVDISTRRRAEYSTDASLYRVLPRAVAFPRHADEVAAALEVCRAAGVPLTSRGAGTSIAGNAVGTGVVLDLSRHLNAVRAVDPDARTAVVEPGVVLADLQRRAGPYGLRFGPDPSTHNRCTLGGMIGNNACGSRALAYGRTSDNVLALDVLAGTGERLSLDSGSGADSPLLERLAEVARAHLAVIRTELGRFPRQVSGYALEHLLPERGFAVARMLTGSEGTCAVTLGATLRLVDAPAATVLAVLGYPDMATAADAVPAVLPHGPVALEGIDARIVGVVRDRRGPAAVPPLPAGGGWLFAEVPGATPAEAAHRAAALAAGAGALDAVVVTDPAQAAALWRIREDGAGLAARSPAGKPAHAGWEDAAVPPDRLGGYLRDFDALLADRGLTGVPYGHFGDGCLHVRIDFPLDRPGGTADFRGFLCDAARLVASYGGSLSGEHGDGRARGELLPLMYSADALAAFAAVKGVFDPDDVLNPGVIVRPRPLDADLRPAPDGARPRLPRRDLALAYPHDGGDLHAAVHRCTGVGKCRADTTAGGGVMCPSYLATRDEKDSTRGRARVLQELVSGSLTPRGWRAPEALEALDLCLACKGCASDCPTGVDMALYKAEILHQSYRRRLRPASHYSLGALPRWARLAALAPRAVNRLLALPPVAASAKLLGGVDRRRDLPRFAPRTFRQWLAARTAAPPHARPVLLWVDTFTDHFTPEVGVAAVTVLEDAGFAVRLTERKVCCGLTWISTGQLDTARRVLSRGLDALGPHLAAGVPVVSLEPSCTAVLRADAAALLGPDDARAVRAAEATHTLAELLARHRPEWTPPRLDGVTAVAQPHCHQHAVMGWQADERLLRAAGASVRTVGGCCGLAGNFGAERGHYDVSAAVAETALLPAVRDLPRDGVVLADGFSCRTQLDQLADRRGLHLAELLAARLGGGEGEADGGGSGGRAARP